MHAVGLLKYAEQRLLGHGLGDHYQPPLRWGAMGGMRRTDSTLSVIPYSWIGDLDMARKGQRRGDAAREDAAGSVTLDFWR
jgi:hypothetical protein